MVERQETLHKAEVQLRRCVCRWLSLGLVSLDHVWAVLAPLLPSDEDLQQRMQHLKPAKRPRAWSGHDPLEEASRVEAEARALAQSYGRAKASLQYFENVLTTLRRSAEADVECPVCLDKADRCNLVIAPCGHVYCRDCAEELLKHRRPCGVCRCAFAAVARLPSLLSPQTEEAACDAVVHNSGTQMSMLLDKLAEFARLGEKAIVFTQFDSLKLSILTALRELSVDVVLCLGGSARRLSGVIRRFRDEPSCGVMVMSIEHCASGLDLTIARHVVLLHPMLAPNRQTARDFERQAVARVWRPGQQRDVHVWRYVTRDTIEEEMLRGLQ
jgi:SNF2 family DNA or RNA helicase